MGNQAGRALAGGLALMLAACSMTPDYVEPKQEMPAEWRHAKEEPPAELPRPRSQWWKAFGSAELDALVEEALANNHDLKAATYRIAQAEAQAGQTEAALLPSVSGNARFNNESPRGGIGSRTLTTSEGKSERTHRASLTTSYEVDLWGKNRASVDAALATAQANAFDRETVATTLVSDVVNSYLQMLQAMAREAVARRNVDTMRRGLEAVVERVRVGESTEIEAVQQRNVLARTEANIPRLVFQREQARDKLAALLGRPPRSLEIGARNLDGLTVPEVDPGLPAELLLRRPDIRKAEAELRAANANIGVARAKMLPSLSLTGERGIANQALTSLLDPTGIFWSFGGSLTGAIFDAGKNKAEIAYSQARFSELVERYRQAIFNSLRDVEDALAEVRYNGENVAAQGEILRLSRNAFQLSYEAYRIGMVDYTYVLETERTQYEVEDTHVQALFGRYAAAVSLFKALGGGFNAEPAPVAQPAPTPASTPGAPEGASAKEG